MSKGQIDTRKKRGYHKTPQRKAAVKAYNASPKGRYQAHKLNARTRGIDFELTFDEWWAIWEPMWGFRGRGRGRYHMCRHGDTGPYSVDNVYLGKHEENARLQPAIGNKGRPLPDEAVQKIIELREFGVMIYKISEHVGCSRGTVRRYIQEHEGRK